jgi:hypothetical protein
VVYLGVSGMVDAEERAQVACWIPEAAAQGLVEICSV